MFMLSPALAEPLLAYESKILVGREELDFLRCCIASSFLQAPFLAGIEKILVTGVCKICESCRKAFCSGLKVNVRLFLAGRSIVFFTPVKSKGDVSLTVRGIV